MIHFKRLLSLLRLEGLCFCLCKIVKVAVLLKIPSATLVDRNRTYCDHNF